MRATIVAALAGVLAVVPTAATAGPAPSYSKAVSNPRVDPYYPDKGSASIDALHYDLDLDWAADTEELAGVATIRFRAPDDESQIHLDLGRPLRVDGARLDGADVGVTHSGNDLNATTGPLVAGSRHTLVVAYHGHPRLTPAPTNRRDERGLGWHTTPSGQVWTMQEPFGAFTWYPVNDHPSDKAYYDVTVHTRSGWRAVSNGALVDDHVAGGRRSMSWHLASPAASYLVTLAIGPYRAHHDTGPHGLPITYWLRNQDRALLASLRKTPAMLRWLESRLGRYPFGRAGTVVVPSRSAMETQTLVTMGSKVLTQPYGPSDLLHEYSHQWYGDTVTPSTWRDLWLNESFAMYVQIRWEVTHGRRSMAAWRNDLVTYDQQLRDAYGPPGNYERWAFAQTNVYYCGALMLDRLRAKIGGRAFARVLRSWPHRHRLANADRADWIAWLDAKTGRHLDRFVHRWLLSQTSPA